MPKEEVEYGMAWPAGACKCEWVHDGSEIFVWSLEMGRGEFGDVETIVGVEELEEVMDVEELLTRVEWKNRELGVGKRWMMGGAEGESEEDDDDDGGLEDFEPRWIVFDAEEGEFL